MSKNECTMKKVLILLFLLLSVYCPAQWLMGQVLDENNHPLIYANIGVIGKAVGATTDEDGHFKIKTKVLDQSDSLRISMLGYESKTFYWKDIFSLNELKVQLKKHSITLQEIQVNSSSFKQSRDLGSKSESKKLVTGWTGYGMGGERGIRLKVKKEQTFIKSVHFHIANSSFDSLLFRLQIRNLENKSPGKKLLHKNIFIKTQIQSGWVHTDLSKYNILVGEDVLLSLEWIKGWKKGKAPSQLLLSMALLKGNLYAREASEALWTRKKSMSPSIYATVKF